MAEDRTTAPAPRAAPDEVWARVREDYLAGTAAADCCRLHGVGRTALHERAAREGWRRRDQPWVSPARLDPWDEGVALEERIGGDLDQLDYCELQAVAIARMMRAVLRGDAAGALRWHRVGRIMDAGQAEIDALMDREAATRRNLAGQRELDDYLRERAEARAAARDDPDSADSADCVFESGPPAPTDL